MSLPSKYAPESLSSSDQRKVITVGHHRPRKPVEYIYKTLNDKVDEAVQNEKSHDNFQEDVEMVPIDDDRQVEMISSYVSTSRNNGELDEGSLIDMEVESDDNQLNENNVSYLVIDTNFILSHLRILDELKRRANEFALKLVIPIAVMKELDGLKKSTRNSNDSGENVTGESVNHLARWANDWIYAALANNSESVIGQQMKQRLDKTTIQDDAILDCCLYFKEKYSDRLVVLLSNDKNLCMKALTNGILTVSYRKNMSADIIANAIYSENLRRNKKVNIDDHFTPAYNTTNIKDTSLNTSSTNSSSNFEEVTNSIFEEIQSITVSIIHRCMMLTYGDDIDLLKDYDKTYLRSLRDCSETLIRFWFPVFLTYFSRSFDNFKPFEERGNAKTTTKLPIFFSVPKNIQELREFVEFWSRSLKVLYLVEMNEEQNNALNLLVKRWHKLIEKFK
ncbi:uncharacterized protein PRCAT00001747001 [Priceomyces carsonii]|uniref:uncharacterized protein n=1 Tax=Priceomyces carsonii TaxID=28549 RepID=UPI002ED7B903|nr:unnamed protein product [Priceomyces carsonii]